MGSIADRYDRSAARYERWWAPVLAPSAVALLPALERRWPGPDRPRRILDVGSGTGTLARAVVERWPDATVVGLDASGAMLQVARGESERRLRPADAARLEWRTGLAEALPFPDASFDLVVSSFAMQLVPSRRRALDEARRVLRPEGWLGYVTWLAEDIPFEPQAIVDDLIDEERLADGLEAEEPRAGDPPSVGAAAAQARRAGFREVRAERALLEHAWTARSYLGFVERYDAADLFESLAPARRRVVREGLQQRLAPLAGTAFQWTAPVVMLTGRRRA
jgi:ubiquinone/menaquinone biosynthesis C-methylase UbiE